MLGLFLMFIGISSIADGEPFGVLMGLGGFYLLARQFEESRDRRRRERDSDREFDRWRDENPHEVYNFEDVSDVVDKRATANADRVYSHALQAVQNAGLDVTELPVVPVDLGVFAHQIGDSTPQLYRNNRVPKDIDYIQPFVQLRLPKRARGKITFEIIDDTGEVVFRRSDQHDLNRGRNLVVPAARLPVHDALDMEEGGWSLNIKADGMLLAIHHFDWLEPSDNFVADHLTDDGEISQELRAAMAESRLEDMSLDELLSFQNEAPPKRRQL